MKVSLNKYSIFLYLVLKMNVKIPKLMTAYIAFFTNLKMTFIIVTENDFTKNETLSFVCNPIIFKLSLWSEMFHT